MSWTLERKLTVGFAIILGILLINALIAASCIPGSFASNGRWVLHSHFVLSEVDELESGLKDAGYGVLGYVLTSRQGFLDRDRRRMGEVADRLANLRHLTRDNPVQQAEVARIEQAVAPLAGPRSRRPSAFATRRASRPPASESWSRGTGRCGSTSGTSSTPSRGKRNSLFRRRMEETGANLQWGIASFATAMGMALALLIALYAHGAARHCRAAAGRGFGPRRRGARPPLARIDR